MRGSRQSRELAAGITKAIELGDPEAQRPLARLRVAALPDNSATVADVAWSDHAVVAEALRRAAEWTRRGQGRPFKTA